MKKKILAITVLIIMTIMLSGCLEQTPVTKPEPVTGFDYGSVKTIQEDEGPSQGGTLNLFMVNPDTLNPLTTRNQYVRQLSGFVFDGLFFENEDGSVINGLAESFTFSQDGLILDLQLRDQILFHDGRELSADDVAFTIKTIQDAGQRSLYKEYASGIDSVKVINRLSLRIILKKSDPRIIEKLIFPVIPQHVFENWPVEGHSETMKLIGTGPFLFDIYQADEIKLARNNSWWYGKIPDGLSHPIWPDGITFKVFQDESEMMQAFQRQQIDIAWLEDGDLGSYSRRSDIFYNRYESNILEFIVLSPVGETGSPIAREDFRSIIMRYLAWYEETDPIDKGAACLNYFTEGNGDTAFMNRAAVLQALNEAGFTYDSDKNILVFYRNGVKTSVKLSIKYNGLDIDRQDTGEWVKKALFDIGIQVTPETTSYDKQQSIIKSGKFDMMILGCRIPYHTDTIETLELLKESLNLSGNNSVILPLYRKYGAVLYQNYIRGPRNPIWKNIYHGWQEWYLVKAPEDGTQTVSPQ